MGKTRRFNKKRAYKKRRTIRKQRKSRKYHGGACELKPISELANDFPKPKIESLGWALTPNVNKFITFYKDKKIISFGQISAASYNNNNNATATINSVSLCGNTSQPKIIYDYKSNTTNQGADYYTLQGISKYDGKCEPVDCY